MDKYIYMQYDNCRGLLLPNTALWVDITMCTSGSATFTISPKNVMDEKFWLTEHAADKLWTWKRKRKWEKTSPLTHKVVWWQHKATYLLMVRNQVSHTASCCSEGCWKILHNGTIARCLPQGSTRDALVYLLVIYPGSSIVAVKLTVRNTTVWMWNRMSEQAVIRDLCSLKPTQPNTTDTVYWIIHANGGLRKWLYC